MKDIKEHARLSEHSTLKVGGSARYLFEIEDKSEIPEAIAFAKGRNLPVLFIGGGSNILFDDIGFRGLVMKVAIKGISHRREGDTVFVTAAAGEEWDKFVEYTITSGFFGLENLSAIPGFVGGAPIQNIGAYGVEVGDLISLVEVFDTRDASFKNLKPEECKFGYRDTVFKTSEGKKFIVVAVTFKLSKNPHANITYKDLAHHFVANQKPTPSEVRRAVIEIRGRKFPNLKTFGTAGSFFKNVICDAEKAESLKAKYPDLPVYDAGEGLPAGQAGKKKISTAFILDKICDLRGERDREVGLFENQSLVVVNYGKATSEDIKNFVSKIKKIVKEKTGIDLEEEVVII